MSRFDPLCGNFYWTSVRHGMVVGGRGDITNLYRCNENQSTLWGDFNLQMAALEAKTSSLNEDNQLLREKEDEIETKGKSKSKPRVPLYADCENSVNTYLLWE